MHLRLGFGTDTSFPLPLLSDEPPQSSPDEEGAEWQQPPGDQPTAEEAESSGSRYPEPPERAFYLPDLLAKAAYFTIAKEVDETFYNHVVYGLQNDPAKVGGHQDARGFFQSPITCN